MRHFLIATPLLAPADAGASSPAEDGSLTPIYGKRVIIIGGGAQVGQVAIGAISEADRHNIRGERISVDTIPLVGEQAIADAVRAADFVGAKTVLGVHYDTFPPIAIDRDAAVTAFAERGITLLLPAIGETVSL